MDEIPKKKGNSLQSLPFNINIIIFENTQI